MVQGFHLSCLPYRITIFLAFIILEILTGHKQKKQYVIFLHVHRKNLVKEKKIIVVQKCVSITFPVQFSSGQSFSFPGRATDTAVPTGWMTLGTLEQQFQTSFHTGKLSLLFYLFFPVQHIHTYLKFSEKLFAWTIYYL